MATEAETCPSYRFGVVPDIVVQDRRNTTAAKGFFKRPLAGLKFKPGRVITDGLTSDGMAYREILPEAKTEGLFSRPP